MVKSICTIKRISHWQIMRLNPPNLITMVKTIPSSFKTFSKTFKSTNIKLNKHNFFKRDFLNKPFFKAVEPFDLLTFRCLWLYGCFVDRIILSIKKLWLSTSSAMAFTLTRLMCSRSDADSLLCQCFLRQFLFSFFGRCELLERSFLFSQEFCRLSSSTMLQIVSVCSFHNSQNNWIN